MSSLPLQGERVRTSVTPEELGEELLCSSTSRGAAQWDSHLCRPLDASGSSGRAGGGLQGEVSGEREVWLPERGSSLLRGPGHGQ